MQCTLFDLNPPNFPRLYIFKNRTELGAIYQNIDWFSLTKLLTKKSTNAGAPSILSLQVYFGIIF